MADETETTTGADGDASQTEMETITLNNRQITVPKSAAQILKEAESSLMSGYQAKLQKEREETKQRLDEDTTWYSTHTQDVWPLYDPKVQGGKGFTGDESQLTAKKEQPVTTPTVNEKTTPVSFGDEMRVKQLEREHEELKKKVENIEVSDFKKGQEQVKQERDALLIKYPFADTTAVNDALGVFFRDNGRHPLKSEIEKCVKRSNDFIAIKVANAQQGMVPKQTAMPSASSTSPLTKRDKLPPLDDVAAWAKMAREDLAAG